jgi:hypothetical protein
LKKSSRLRRVKVELSGGDEKLAPVLSKELGGRPQWACKPQVAR